MRIIVDADACPGKHMIEKVARKHNVPLMYYCDINHILSTEVATVKYMDSGFQSVDMAIANEAKAGDVVITQDYGVAAMVLAKGSYAINPKGHVYDQGNIDRLLFERHLSSKVRRGGGRTANARKRNEEDDERLYENLNKLVMQHI